MIAVNGLVQSLSGVVSRRSKCERCGATTRLGEGTCVNCLLAEGLEAEQQASVAAFESVLAEADVPDKEWRLGNYEILEEIGRGGMGVIYRARQRHSRRIVALKRVMTYQADSHETLARFRREAEAAASLDHPNILPIYEVNETEEGLPFFSMKLAAGGSLRTAASVLAEEPRECVRLMAKVARAIDFAHGQGILHRDLQPGNILLDARGEPLVSDFGLAKWLDQESNLTRTLTSFGTPGYIAPEQAEGNGFTPAADIYSLGAVLFNLLAGRPPFIGGNALSVIRHAAATPAPKIRSLAPALGRDLETILARCLEREPKARYQTAGALAEDFERWLDGRPIVARPVRAPARIWRWSRRNPMLASAAVACFLLTGALIGLLRQQFHASPPAPPPEKSIAVLPFQNLSQDQENAFFADGVQDEILTSLAKVADLKVISRTSVMQYKDTARRNLRDIAQQLRVAHVLEGSVQRTANRVRVNAQLIDARNDEHLWAQTYDGDLANVFAIQSEIAKAIADQLQAKISPGEKAAIAQPPTTDLVANALYQKALALEFTPPEHENLLEAVRLLEEGVARDPRFLLAYTTAGRMHLTLYFGGYDHSPARRDLANAAIENAARLQPDAGEVHLARARYWLHGFRDYDRARIELDLARRTLPNDSKIYFLSAVIDRRQARWSESVRNFERAVELDPRNVEFLMNAGGTYRRLRRYPEAVQMFERAVAVAPHDYFARIMGASQPLEEKADARPLRAELNAILAEEPDAASKIADVLFYCAIVERDRAAIDRALAVIPPEGISPGGNFIWPREWYVALAARTFNDPATEQPAFIATRAILEKIVREQPDYAPAWSLLGRVNVALGRQEEGLQQARRACELLPLPKDAWLGPNYVASLAWAYAWAGDKDAAIEQLASLPLPWISYGTLKLNPEWDSLRGDPRFEQIVAALAPEPNSANRSAPLPSALPSLPEKSIAVLPFENLSDDKQNAYFADGVQDEILTSLAKVGDLKVISRTSVMQYKDTAKRNVRETAQQLGVAHLLEGSVQRAGNRVRVNAQLIDARTDTHLWAEHYDRDLADVFAIQTEIAGAIADQLKAKISPGEKAEMAQPPTTDLIANDLYRQALALDRQLPYHQSILKAVDLLKKAVARDPHFYLAYCALARMHLGYDHTASRLQMAEVAIGKAAELKPEAGEVHLVRALYDREVRDYDRARAELELARRTLPNNPAVYFETGAIDRRQGRWTEAVRNLDRAIELDPRNLDFLDDAASTYSAMRRYGEAAQLCRRTLAISPNDYFARLRCADQPLLERADIRPLRAELDAILAEEPEAAPKIADALLMCALLERDAAAADRALAAIPPEGIGGFPNVVLPPEWWVGRVARTFNRPEDARVAFETTRAIFEKMLREQPDNASAWSLLGRVEAALGRKEEAIKAGRRGCELLPLSREATSGLRPLLDLAKIYAAVGDKDLAVQQLATSAGQIMGITYGQLKLEPEWDSLRGDPRFEKIVASLAPKRLK